MAVSPPMSITTPLGDGVLLFHTLTARDELGALPQYDITVLSAKRDIDPTALLGKTVTVKVELLSGKQRYFHGYVVRFALAGKRGRYFRYQITARPWLWFLTRKSDCRIFQGKKAPDIIKAVLGTYDGLASYQLSGTYRVRDYCVQYRETDFNFVSRLMEEEGIYYYFDHSDGKHEMKLTDGAHTDSKDVPTLPFIDPDRVTREEQDHVSAWSFSREIQPVVYSLEDYNFETPSVDLMQKRTEKLDFPQSKLEYYDYPGLYSTGTEGTHYVQVRLEELHAEYELAQGSTNARGLCTGDLFKLTNFPRDEQNQQYLVTGASHQLEYGDYESIGDMPTRYACRFTALPHSRPFRRRRVTPKPVVHGVQPALVVGPAGDEIHTDKYGRIKVQFYWDREGKKDANSSCWVRVATPWAGKQWGMIHIPRMGQEVVVDFVEGDPDQPLVIGSVYNAEQMPPWALPDNMTQSGVLSRSSKGGTSANANAIRFEDKKGSEEVWIHAEKDQRIEVEHDESHWVGHDRTKTIDHDETTHVKHDRTETVDNNETITIHGMRTETVDKDETITIHQNRTETVDLNETVTISGNQTHTISQSETKLVSMQRTHTVGINETITVGAAQQITVGGAQAITVGAVQAITVGAAQIIGVGADQTTTVGGDQGNTVTGNQNEAVTGDASRSVTGNETISVTGDRKKKVDGSDEAKVASSFAVVADEQISLTSGDASITLSKDGTILIKGKDITIQGSGKINVQADGDCVMKGSKITQN